MKTTINEKKLGMIMGALIGDALGSQYEFYSKNTIKQKYKDNNNMIDFFTTPNYLFNPSYNIVKNTGELSDDGQLIMALIHHLQTDIKPSIEPYKKWFSVNPDDMGITIHQALQTGIPSKTSKSNGPLMKVMPWLLLSDKLSIETLLKYIEIDCKFTHTNSELIFNLLYYSMCLYLAITNKYCKDLKIFHHDYKIYNSFYNEFAITDNKDIDYLTNRGYCKIALLNAIYQLTHADSYEECIENTILEGGDTDTNACIAGALYGAVYGINMIPKKWQDIVKNAKSSLGSDYEPKNIETLINNINNKKIL